MWPSWAVRPNEPSGFRGRKVLLNHASALVPNMSTISEDIRHHFIMIMIIIIIFTPACPEQYTHGEFPKVDVDH